MATLRDIKRRITSVTNTQQITSAMKMISAAKLARAQQAAHRAQPYAEKLRHMVTTMSQGMTGDDHPLLAESTEGKPLVILFVSDRGLCGGFNNNLNRLVHKSITQDKNLAGAELVIFGRTANDFFRRRNITIQEAFLQLRDAERRVELKKVVDKAIQGYLSGEISRVFLAYNHFANAITQVPVVRPLLPIVPPEKDDSVSEVDERETIFEPNRRDILDSLLPRYLENQGLLAQLNTEAGEHGARMVAMEGATKNAGEMIARLTLQYNRARQAAITRELIEIISGAESL